MFRPHRGTCIDCPEDTISLIIVKSGRCFKHNEEYKESKKSPERKERERLKKEERIRKAQSYRPKPRKVTGELEVFNRIWSTREHKCEVCEHPIIRRKENFVKMFSHVASKGSEGSLRLDEENILLMGDGWFDNCDCHLKWEYRTAEMREIEMWKPIFLLHEALKRKVNNPDEQLQ